LSALLGASLRSWLKICGFLDPIFDPGAQRPQQFGLQRRATDALASLDTCDPHRRREIRIQNPHGEYRAGARGQAGRRSVEPIGGQAPCNLSSWRLLANPNPLRLIQFCTCILTMAVFTGLPSCDPRNTVLTLRSPGW
jgi:hypothetical protein